MYRSGIILGKILKERCFIPLILLTIDAVYCSAGGDGVISTLYNHNKSGDHCLLQTMKRKMKDREQKNEK